MSRFNNLDELNLSDDVKALNPELVGRKLSTPSKYKNVRTEAAGMTFSSGKEAAEMGKLMLADEKHLIFGLRLQVKFPLPGGDSYTADATYLEYDERIGQLKIHIVDAKGMLTKDFKNKAKRFERYYGQPIELL